MWSCGRASSTALSCLQCCEAIYSSVSGLKAHLASCSKVSSGIISMACAGVGGWGEQGALMTSSCQGFTCISVRRPQHVVPETVDGPESLSVPCTSHLVPRAALESPTLHGVNVCPDLSRGHTWLGMRTFTKGVRALAALPSSHSLVAAPVAGVV